VLAESDSQKKKEMLRSETTFNLWQSILRGAGVITGCRRCADVCPVGEDYERMLADALEQIAEDTAAKQMRLVDMVNAEHNALPQGYKRQQRWIGRLKRERDAP
jgi:epoxyqueuosine reductase